MMEKEQYEPWQQAAIGYVSPSAEGVREEPAVGLGSEEQAVQRLDEDHAAERLLGPDGYASAACMADFIIVNMVAEAVSGSKTVKEGDGRAKARAERYYKV
jgi:multiple sugar transport system substrate-binding protein